MGYAQSRIDNKKSVARCKECRNLMKKVVIARNDFAVGHSGYAMALKNVGTALNDYGHGESIVTPELQPPPLDASTQSQSPPPLLNFSPSPLKWAASIPLTIMLSFDQNPNPTFFWKAKRRNRLAKEEEDLGSHFSCMKLT